ncbi:thiamine biosynthesis lipoprotein ApbE [Rhodovulum sulfidophilum]|uniref:Thiamine biosynthesis lipoprotein ApbE n=1 Tax=Rhodovulum sulfidophilum TaxID=35806 RepID=A0A0D6B632_RHOSU|nr:thiamine biosynthesis lipoprotein ApbE [Rhodovulum sulfidophilum]
MRRWLTARHRSRCWRRPAIEADARASALILLGGAAGAVLARRLGLSALVFERDDGEIRETPVGLGFAGARAARAGERPAPGRAGLSQVLWALSAAGRSEPV